jgi:hypothetical protein
MHNLNNYHGSNPQPTFVPQIKLNGPIKPQYLYIGKSDAAICLENVVPEHLCQSLIAQFDQQEQYPVGVDGYAIAAENPGSYRAMAWGEEVANYITMRMLDHIPTWFSKRNGALKAFYGYREIDQKLKSLEFRVPFDLGIGQYSVLGSTPWLRFMKYASGGKHTPHYDAPFHNEEERYITMYSWVLYLNTPKGMGGAFQFVDDGQLDLHPSERNKDDWRVMSDNIIHSIEPKEGSLLIFPHWLCHQVQEFIGLGHRYIIRGDLAYGY